LAKDAAVGEDPFERLRSTAIQSMRDRAMEEEPRHAPLDFPEATSKGNAEPAQDDDTQLCQPATPYPTAILWILDDGQRTGQAVRMRRFPLVIGRTQGDVRIPHDPAIDDPHLELSWRDGDSGPQLVIRDLGSRAGLFARVAKGKIKAGQEIRIGSGCYRFSEACVLEEISPQSEHCLPRAGTDAWLGRIPECEPLHLSTDPMADSRHARITESDGVWALEDNDSLNGTWIRAPEIVARARAEFLIGEQAMIVTIQRRAPPPQTVNRS